MHRWFLAWMDVEVTGQCVLRGWRTARIEIRTHTRQQAAAKGGASSDPKRHTVAPQDSGSRTPEWIDDDERAADVLAVQAAQHVLPRHQVGADEEHLGRAVAKRAAAAWLLRCERQQMAE